MKVPALIAAAMALCNSAQAAPLSERDFQQLMQAAVAASAKTAQPDTQTICVQRELESPLKFSRAAMEATHVSGVPGMPVVHLSQAQDAAVEKAFGSALTAKATVDARTTLSFLTPQFMLYSSASRVPNRCAIDHRWASGSTNHAISITLTRPVFVDGYAFVDEATDCPGLCGSGWLRIFEKQGSRWKQIAVRNLFVS